MFSCWRLLSGGLGRCAGKSVRSLKLRAGFESFSDVQQATLEMYFFKGLDQFVLARLRAFMLGFHLVLRIATFTLSRVARPTLPFLLTTFETVAVETPASSAMSLIVTRMLFCTLEVAAPTFKWLSSQLEKFIQEPLQQRTS